MADEKKDPSAGPPRADPPGKRGAGASVGERSSSVKDESFASLFERSAGATARRRSFQSGERVEVTVVAIGRDAVFADMGAKQEGYFDRAKLSDGDGNLRVTVGAKIAAVVASADDASGHVHLSPVFVRRADDGEGDAGGEIAIPVTRAAPLMVEGARVKGKVTGIERYGVFVQIAGTEGRGGRGLVPTAETATPRGADLKKHFTVGQDVEAKILAIAEDGKIRLSIGALKADDERGEFQEFADKSRKREEEQGKRGFGTLGQLFSKKGKG